MLSFLGISNLTEYLGKTFTAPGSGFVVYYYKHTTNFLLMVGRHIGEWLDKINLLAIFLRKFQSRQSLHILFFCSVLLSPSVAAF